jgi:hypothetical protein
MQTRITKESILALVSDGVCESRQLEYKRDWVGKSDNYKKEFLADAVSFANTVGGVMLFGIDEERDADGKHTGIPKAAVGLEIGSTDEELRRIEDMIRTSITPRLPGVTISQIDGFPKGPVIAIQIPRSHRSPHMVSFNEKLRFYARVDRSRYPLDIDELRDAFLRAEAIPARIRDFRSSRVHAIDAGETPVPMEPGPRFVVHIVPLDTFSDPRAVSFSDINRAGQDMRVMRAGSFNRSINLDGPLIWAPVKGGGPRESLSYVQLFRDAAIEAVDGVTLTPASDERAGTVLPEEIEVLIVAQLAEYSRCFAATPIGTQLVIMVTLMNAAGFHVLPRHDRYDERVIDRRILEIPDVVVQRDVATSPSTLKPVLDMLWQACGVSCSPYFTDEGEWINPRKNG